jgi:4-diphosphocytidyl-2-C-methyl-D-erythritol kinase
MSGVKAFAKINLSLVVGPPRPNGKHEVVTILQRIDLHDEIELEPRSEPGIDVDGFREDTLVRAALERLADAADIASGWRVRIEKRIPVAGGFGGGSSDAAAALELANATLAEPVDVGELGAIGAGIGADVPFFLGEGPQVATGDGTCLSRVELPQDYWAVLVLSQDVAKESTATVYERFDDRGGGKGFEERRAALFDALGHVEHPRDLVALPRNDLESSPIADELERLGAFRADVTGAGPAVYGLFERRKDAEHAVSSFRGTVWTRLARPVAGR